MQYLMIYFPSFCKMITFSSAVLDSPVLPQNSLVCELYFVEQKLRNRLHFVLITTCITQWWIKVKSVVKRWMDDSHNLYIVDDPFALTTERRTFWNLEIFLQIKILKLEKYLKSKNCF